MCVRETQKSIRESVHRLLTDQIAALGLSSFYNVQQVAITGVNGTTFAFTGLSDLTAASIKSFESCTTCWVEEGHAVTNRSWTILLPTLFRVPECELWVSFNPELDTDPTWKLFVEDPPEDTWSVSINWDSNPFFPEELNKLRLHQLKTMSKTDYEWIWEGKCRAAAEGAIYTPEMQALAESKRVMPIAIDPVLKVHTAWDVGFSDRTAIILVQKNATQLLIVGYIEDNHRNMVDYGSQLRNMNLNWGDDWLPWDASREKYKLTDPASSPEGILQGMGRSVRIVPKSSVEVGIHRARLVFPKCYFDKESTVRLRECLKRYKRTIPATTGEPTTPAHDEYSHGADAFRYLAMASEQFRNEDGFKRINYPKLAFA
jgi:phage terminase large subunit